LGCQRHWVYGWEQKSPNKELNVLEGRTIIKALRISSDDILRALGGLSEKFVHCVTLTEMASKAAIRNYNTHKAAPWKRLHQQKH